MYKKNRQLFTIGQIQYAHIITTSTI